MKPDIRDKDLQEMLQYVGEILIEAEKILQFYDKKGRDDELKQKVFITERTQLIHEKTHRVCSIAAQPPITDLARNQVQPEVSRLKEIMYAYRKIVDKYNEPRHERDF